MKIKKKGFTLIELLAVIVILAIIAVIAVPIVLNIIKESKESATLRSGEFYLDAVELSLAQAKLKNKNITDGKYNIKNGNICLDTACTDILEVEVNGEKPTSGTLTISNGKIVEGTTINFENTSLVLNNNKLAVGDSKNLLSNKILGENNKNVVTSGDGLYVSTATNDGRPTYYYKGNLVNNYVDFAGKTWRVIRINEDGTIKLILDDRINNKKNIEFNPNTTNYMYMYYSESDIEGGIKKELDNWYTNTLEENYDSYIATTNFCESAKVKDSDDSTTSGNATMELMANYTPNYECQLDGNEKQYVSSKLGLITIDEGLMTGMSLATGQLTKNTNTWLLMSETWWTMSPAGLWYNEDALAWTANSYGYVSEMYVNSEGNGVYPVISLNANVTVEESNENGIHGSNTNPYVIKTN